ncbi:hypothetical protein [Corallococcus aberystwythensis]|uniref:Uncharacterized protein n=1 Tax=Corallococcus aberystwythensis TaxID=2316722 RepID=A0A3A8R0H4_9BACT|nr:hypothetical protein [Corallococcus aberystwythensis]RKH74539.1 hypothetical protein D7W81_00875 [Corallococcus aberystwythensis]
MNVAPPAPGKAAPTPVQQRLTQDLFTPDTRSRQTVSYFGGNGGPPFTPPPASPTPGVISTPVASTPVTQTAQVNTPAPAATVSPEVQTALDNINKYQPAAQPIGLASELQMHGSDSAEDVAFRKELMAALGPDRVAELMGRVGPLSEEMPGLARTVLSAAIEAYPVADQGKVVQGMGPEVLGAALATGVELAGSPLTFNREESVAQMQALATMMGNLSALPPGSPGQAEVTAALDRIKSGEQPSEAPGASTAAWLVANSGSDSLRASFANGYLEELKADPASLSSEEARAVAWALGSMTQSPTDGLGALADLPDAARSQFLNVLGGPDAPELEHTGAFFQEDVQAGVNEFLGDVARLNPANFSNAQAAKELRIEAFQQVSLAVDGDFFNDGAQTHLALAGMFAADTEGIVDTSANSDYDNRLYDKEGRAMAKFFDRVAFRDEGSRGLVTEALHRYLGQGTQDGLVPQLVQGQGEDGFMADGGNILARNMGFVLGALYQGSQSAMQGMDDEFARKKAMVDVMGSLVEKAIEATPGVGAAYAKIKSGTADQVSVDKVFGWLGDQFGGNVDASKDGVKALSGTIISDAWTPFFGNDALKGAIPGNLTAMFGFINGAVALADGITGDPNINIGGAAYGR